MIEILTAKEVATLLRVSTRHVYELTQTRTRVGDLREDPLPFVKFGSSVRFRKSDVEQWVENQATKKSER